MKEIAKDQQEYWMGVGMLLYMVKHWHANLTNAIRELSKAINGTNPTVYEGLICVIKYNMDTKIVGLK